MNQPSNSLIILDCLQSVSLHKSHSYVLSKADIISNVDSVEAMVSEVEDSSNNAMKGFQFHFLCVRNEILQALWGAGIYLGRALIENILFCAIKEKPVSLANELAKIIANNNLGKAGFLIYPLHSFGIADAGMAQFFGKMQTSIEMPRQGLVIFPQSNKKELICKRLKRVMKLFDMPAEMDERLVEHFLVSRSLNWLHKNPVLFVKSNMFQWDIYSNHFAIKLKLTLTKTYVLFLHLHSNRDSKNYEFTSTAKVNNYETLDIRHYLYVQPSMRDESRYDMECIPMNAEPNEMAELSELSVDLIPSEWGRRGRYAANLKLAFDKVEAGIVHHCYFAVGDRNRKTVFSKLKNSMAYFNKSFRKADKMDDAIVMLSIAFETLLLDNYSSGIGGVLDRRVRLALKGSRSCSRYWDKVGQLYSARCEVVHGGETKRKVDLRLCQQAFSMCWQKIAVTAQNLPVTSIDNPVGFLLGEVSSSRGNN